MNANNVNDDWDDHKSSKDSRASKLSTQLPTAEKNIIPQQQEITQQQEQGDNH